MTEHCEHLVVELIYNHTQQNWHADIFGVGEVNGSILDILTAAGKSGWELHSFNSATWGPAYPTGRREPKERMRVDSYSASFLRPIERK